MRLSQYDKITEVDHETSVLRFHETQKGVTPRRVAFADPWEYEEYAGLIGNGQRLEVFYIASADDQIALEYTYSLRRMIDTWQYNSGKPKTWGDAHDVTNPMALIDYQRYTQADEACVGFHTSWEHPYNDPDSRPGRVMFGFLCNQNGKQLSDEVIEDTLKNIGVKGITERIRRKDAQQLATNFGEMSNILPENTSAALAIAKGTPSTATGNQNFPFELAVTFSEDGETNTLEN